MPDSKLIQSSVVGYDLTKTTAVGSTGLKRKLKYQAAWSNTWPAPGASLDLDFVNNRGFVRGIGQGGVMDALTFTRASDGRYVGQDGLLKSSYPTGPSTYEKTINSVGMINLFTYSEQFENGVWYKGGQYAALSNQAIAPDGSLTADLLYVTNGGNSGYIYQYPTSISTSNVYTISIYVKNSGGYRYAYLKTQPKNFTENYGIFVDTTNGQLVREVISSANGSHSIQDVGNGWYRISISISNGTHNPLYFEMTDNYTLALGSYGDVGTGTNGNGSRGMYVWGGMIENNGSLSQPRFDWASTAIGNQNILPYSNKFSQWVGIGRSGITVTDNSIVAPDGTTTASKLLMNTTSIAQGQKQVGFPSGTISSAGTYTFSVYVAAGNLNFVAIGGYDNTAYRGATFNLTTGAISNLVGGATATAVNVGSGWWRLSVTVTTVSGFNTSYSGVWPYATAVSIGSNNNITDNTSYISVWHAQLQTGISVTDYLENELYIPTSTPLVANPTSNGLLIEDARTNRALWCRDGLNGGTAVGTNLQTYSENYGVGWSVYNVTRTTEQTDPNSTNNATLLTCTASTGVHGLSYGTNNIPAGTNMVVAYVKSGTWNYVSIGFNNNTSYGTVTFDLSNPTAATKTGSSVYTVVSSSITSVGNGWYRLTAVVTASTVSGVQLWLNSSTTPTYTNGNESWTAAGTESVYVWGIQVLPYTHLTDYQVTTSSAIYAWSKLNVTVAKDQTGIDGVSNAATSITATSNNAILIQPVSLASGSRTASVYLKRINGTGIVQVTLDGSTWSTVDLSNGLWNRVVLSGTVTNPCVGIKIATSGDSVAADFAQIEDGLFATSPILSTTSSTIRSADVTVISTDSQRSWLDEKGGTFYVNATNFIVPDLGGDEFAVPFSVMGPSNNWFFIARYDGGGSYNSALIQYRFSPYGTILTSTNYSLGVGMRGNQEYKIALSAFETELRAVSSFGNIVSAETLNNPLTKIGNSFGIGYSTRGPVLNGWIKRYTYTPKRLTIDQLKELVI